MAARFRLHLMRVLMTNPNFLILDEPTNDLDIDTLNVLEEFLLNYKGCLLLVSHDRYLVDKLTDQLFIFEGNGEVQIYNGNYTDYRLEREEAEELKKAKLKAEKEREKEKVKQEALAEKQKPKLSYKEQKELETLGNEIAALEDKQKELTAQLNTISEVEKIIAISKELEDIQLSLDDKGLRWLELSDKS
jgi:ATP-binding cassette subfamily F protein uup